MELRKILRLAVKMNASDIHIRPEAPPKIRVDGILENLTENKLSKEIVEDYIKELSRTKYDEFKTRLQLDLGITFDGIGRFRVHIYKQMEGNTLAIRVIQETIPTLESLEFCEAIKKITHIENGLILVTGDVGSGKSTTVAAMIDEVNAHRQLNIITLEDPIEYIHSQKKSIINQRELGRDFYNYKEAIRGSLRSDGDIIYIGELKEKETIRMALNAAETGYLVISTMHTYSANKTIDRIINFFQGEEEIRIRYQLSTVLKAIICQSLIRKIHGKGRIAAQEIMINIPSIQNLIREGKSYQIPSIIQTGEKYGMKLMDKHIEELRNSHIIK